MECVCMSGRRARAPNLRLSVPLVFLVAATWNCVQSRNHLGFNIANFQCSNDNVAGAEPQVGERLLLPVRVMRRGEQDKSSVVMLAAPCRHQKAGLYRPSCVWMVRSSLADRRMFALKLELNNWMTRLWELTCYPKAVGSLTTSGQAS